MVNTKMSVKTRACFAITLLCFLALAIVLTIAIAWLIYPLEIRWLNLDSVVKMAPDTIWHNFNILLNYLTNPFHWTLNMPDFQSSVDGLHHFEAVKKLFHLAQGVFLVTLPIACVFLKTILKTRTKSLLSRGFALMALTPVIVAGFAGLIGFSQFFVLFHQILFPGDSTWLFHPARDPIIMVLPERYFLHCFILFFIIYETLAIGGYIWTRKN